MSSKDSQQDCRSQGLELDGDEKIAVRNQIIESWLEFHALKETAANIQKVVNQLNLAFAREIAHLYMAYGDAERIIHESRSQPENKLDYMIVQANVVNRALGFPTTRSKKEATSTNTPLSQPTKLEVKRLLIDTFSNLRIGMEKEYPWIECYIRFFSKIGLKAVDVKAYLALERQLLARLHVACIKAEPNTTEIGRIAALISSDVRASSDKSPVKTGILRPDPVFKDLSNTSVLEMLDGLLQLGRSPLASPLRLYANDRPIKTREISEFIAAIFDREPTNHDAYGSDQAPQPDGPEGGSWLWCNGKRHDIPKGVTYRFIDFMWKREAASYAQLDKNVFEDPVQVETVRSRISKVNEVLLKTGVSWRLRSDSRSLHVTKQHLNK